MYNISKKWGVPKKEVSCPGCGQIYGHHNTKVDLISSECSKCVKRLKYKKVELVDANKFIKRYLGYGK